MPIASVYTPQGGYTPQAQGVQSMSDTLAGITGSPAAGALLAAGQAGPNYGATNISQLQSEEEKLRTMFANDQVLAQKYADPNLYGGGAIPPTNNPAGQFASPLQATIDSITNPQGITSPGALIGAVGGDVTGQKSVLQSIMDAMNFSGTRTLDAYKSMMSALGTVYGEEQQNKRTEQQLKAQYGGIIPGMGTGGSLADDYVDQFMTGQISLLDIPAEYRTIVNKRLKDMGTTATKVQETNASTINAINIMQEMLKRWGTMSQAEKLIPQQILGAAPFLSPTRTGITSEFYTTLEPEIRKTAVGGRITQQEIGWIRNAVLPSSLDTPESAAAKVQGVINGLQMKMKNPKMDLSQLNPVDLASGNISGHTDTNLPRLQDTKTGKIYEYDSTKDPDYISDLAKGFRPQ